MSDDTHTNANDVELDTSVASARATNLRETSPELFTGEPKQVSTDATSDVGAASSAADGAAADAGAGAGAEAMASEAAGHDADEPGATGEQQLIPRARVNVIVNEKKAAIIERDQLRARLEAIEQVEQARVAAAAEAAKAPPRDFDAEIEAIEAKYDAGDIDDAEKRALLKPIEKDMRQQLADNAVAAALAAVAERDSLRTKQTQAQQWEDSSARFMADPLNAAYQDPIRIAALNEAMKVVHTERGEKISYDELLQEARDRVEVAFGGAPSKGAETVQQKVARERRELAARAAASASALPDRPGGGIGERGSESGKDVENISRAEWRKLPQAKRDEMLGKTSAPN